MEDVTARAIMIGVGVLVAIATITAVLAYYNTAREAVQRVGAGTDIAAEYEQSISDVLLKNTVTGTEVANILNYFYGNEDTVITLNNISIFNNSYSSNEPVSITISTSSRSSSYDTYYKRVINQIYPNKQYSLSLEKGNGILNITISNKG